MKGFYKAGCKYITNIFVVKEREIEIGLPTDVKHVAHIGWDGTAGAAPSWMNEFKTVPEFATTSIGNSGGLTLLSPWSSQDIGESVEHKTVSGRLKEDEAAAAAPPSSDAGSVARGKHKRKKNRSKSSPRPGATIRSSRPKPKFIETNQNTTNIEVA